MRHTPRETVTMIVVAITLALSGCLVYLLGESVFARIGFWAPLALGVGFCLLYGSMVMVYLRILGIFLPLRPGVYDMQDLQSSLWKHQAILRQMAELALRPFVPVFMNGLFYWAQGARVGRDAAISGTLEDPMLTELGNHSIVGRNACVTAHALVFDTLRIEPVKIGRGATIGVGAVIMPGVVVGDYSVVAAGAVVPPGTQIPAGELWGGLPAVRIKSIERVWVAESVPTPVGATVSM